MPVMMYVELKTAASSGLKLFINRSDVDSLFMRGKKNPRRDMEVLYEGSIRALPWTW